MVKADVNLAHFDPLGNYANRLRFDEKHNKDIYTWKTRYRLAPKCE